MRGPTTAQDGQLGVAQTDDEDCEQGEATHPMEVEDEGERFAPYLFDVRPPPLEHSRMVALSKRLTVCLRHDKGEFGLEWTPQAMTPLEKVLSRAPSLKRSWRWSPTQTRRGSVWVSSRAPSILEHVKGTAWRWRRTMCTPGSILPRSPPSYYDFYASILKTGIKAGGGNPRTRGHIHCLRDHVSQHRFLPPGVEIILHLEHAAHTARWYLTDNGYFVTPDTIPATAITAVTIIAS